jgi:hypothetical protein
MPMSAYEEQALDDAIVRFQKKPIKCRYATLVITKSGPVGTDESMSSPAVGLQSLLPSSSAVVCYTDTHTDDQAREVKLHLPIAGSARDEERELSVSQAQTRASSQQQTCQKV